MQAAILLVASEKRYYELSWGLPDSPLKSYFALYKAVEENGPKDAPERSTFQGVIFSKV
ncbi:hypothetical protein PHLCEN_2v7428 [Hermanssonia centrifuga]|uniref:Uncharacterized protein n=1 Tax=Hermanssonia centrifuga TaxID=98765 RepID=A0A2R6NWJ0_9APHY|nr:hypothetical protein PHLCEN_2v7428 [Hermanssonia centrifuga]